MFGHFCQNRKENHLRKCEGERPVERLGDAFRLPPRDSDRRPGRGGRCSTSTVYSAVGVLLTATGDIVRWCKESLIPRTHLL